MKRITYYPECHNPELYPVATPFVDVRFYKHSQQPAYSFYEVVATSGPVYVGDARRFYLEGSTFGDKSEALAYAETISDGYPILESETYAL